MAFWIVSRRLGPHWALDEEEAAALGAALAQLWDALPIPDTESGLIKASAVLATTMGEVVAGKVAEGKLRAVVAQRPAGVTEAEYLDMLLGEMLGRVMGGGDGATGAPTV